jgi:hypothetical protein
MSFPGLPSKWTLFLLCVPPSLFSFKFNAIFPVDKLCT